MSHLNYLGISIPYALLDLLKLDHNKVIKDIQLKFDSCNNLILTWNARSDISKSFLLPKLLFRFRAIPTNIPDLTLHKEQQMFVQVSWANK